MDGFGNEITTIALYDGESIKYYVQGRNLDAFMDDIEKYSVIVTYNGKTFDVPFIEKYFGIRMNHAHIDLRYVLKSLGYSGGLKRCEKALGLDRKDTPFSRIHALPVPKIPDIPFKPDLSIIERLRQKFPFF
ncbi:MAG: ribonuclease H-like domain-containing protein [Desulfotignum sp.]